MTTGMLSPAGLLSEPVLPRVSMCLHDPSLSLSLPQRQLGLQPSNFKPNQKLSFQRTRESVFPNKTVLNKGRAAGGRLLRHIHFAAFI